MTITNQVDLDVAILRLQELKHQLQRFIAENEGKGSSANIISAPEYYKMKTAFKLLVLDCKDYLAKSKRESELLMQ